MAVCVVKMACIQNIFWVNIEFRLTREAGRELFTNVTCIWVGNWSRTQWTVNRELVTFHLKSERLIFSIDHTTTRKKYCDWCEYFMLISIMRKISSMQKIFQKIIECHSQPFDSFWNIGFVMSALPSSSVTASLASNKRKSNSDGTKTGL